ncbi:Lrg1p [Sugiyamaella lignohabitans]|uniref:Lrg1p n=1 Tax=Sugiyamaella lignohabitans TaxID=796027 RepID=A0A167F0R4_9ASCO|nr:Lrg1p [Sugiyamaella lignohabitans]ANB14681.1 Lrg1p [Sugiyamaella lignohabitans]
MSTAGREKTKNPHNLFLNLHNSNKEANGRTREHREHRQNPPPTQGQSPQQPHHYQPPVPQQQRSRQQQPQQQIPAPHQRQYHQQLRQFPGQPPLQSTGNNVPGLSLNSPVHMANSGANRVHKQSASISGYYPVAGDGASPVIGLESPNQFKGQGYVSDSSGASFGGSTGSNSPRQFSGIDSPTRSIPMTSPRYRNFSRPNTFYQTESSSLGNDVFSRDPGNQSYFQNLPTPPLGGTNTATETTVSSNSKPTTGSNTRSFSIRKVSQDGGDPSFNEPVERMPPMPGTNAGPQGQSQSNWSSHLQTNPITTTTNTSNTSMPPPATNSTRNFQNNSNNTDHVYDSNEPSSSNNSNNNNHNNGALPDTNSNNRVYTTNSVYGANSSLSALNTSGLPNNNSTSSITSPISPSKPARSKTCRKCGDPISGQFVRALDAAYHIECFTCADCNDQCSSKFFPTDNPDYDPTAPSNVPAHIPLCETCYFKRLDLLCYACNGALRGSYITALGRKYHVDHFTCSMCDTVFGPEDSYYEHGDSIYCHFHYSTLYASKCEGCQTAILKQFVEIYRGGREQQWHPECYMIFKFWNVKLCPEGSKPTLNPLRPLSVTAAAPLDQLNHLQVAQHEKEVDERVYRIWTVLCGYEEATASYISDMLQSASNGKYNEALVATANLVAKVDVLFGALDMLNLVIDPLIKEQEDRRKREDEEDELAVNNTGAHDENVRRPSVTSIPTFTVLGREPKNLCKKIVEFMSMVSKSREKNVKKMGVTLLNLVTSLAHYLKVLIRYGLSNSLLYDRSFPNGNAVDSFLQRVEVHTKSVSVLNNLGVSAMTSDRCVRCESSVEDACVRFGDRLWHVGCFLCDKCGRNLSGEVDTAAWHVSEKMVICQECGGKHNSDESGKLGFVYVTRLRQFVFLVKIAVARLQLVLSAYEARDKKAKRISGTGDSMSTPALAHYKASTSASDRSNQSAGSSSTAVNEPTQNEKGYMTTLTDIRRLRSAKLDRQVSEMSRRARQSRILAMPDSESALVKNNNDSSNSLEGGGSTTMNSPDEHEQQRRPSNYSEDKVLVNERSRPSVSSQQDPFASTATSSTHDASSKSQQQTSEGATATTSGSVTTSTNATSGAGSGAGSNKSLLRNAKRTFSIKRRKELKIEELGYKQDPSRLDRTTDLFKNEKTLTLDDIPRIVAAEQAREQLPNAFRHQARTTSMTNSVPMPKSIADSGAKDETRTYMSELSKSELFYIRHVCVVLLQPLVSEWFSQDELLDLIETRRQQSIWGKFGKAFGGGGGNSNTTAAKKKGTGAVFGTPLEQLVEKYGVDSTLGVGPKPLRIPAFVDDCISSMRQKDMSVEGIFRKNGNIRRLKEFTEKIDKNPDKSSILSEENAIQLAALLKKFLRELPEPLMTSKLQKLWIMTQSKYFPLVP